MNTCVGVLYLPLQHLHQVTGHGRSLCGTDQMCSEQLDQFVIRRRHHPGRCSVSISTISRWTVSWTDRHRSSRSRPLRRVRRHCSIPHYCRHRSNSSPSSSSSSWFFLVSSISYSFWISSTSCRFSFSSFSIFSLCSDCSRRPTIVRDVAAFFPKCTPFPFCQSFRVLFAAYRRGLLRTAVGAASFLVRNRSHAVVGLRPARHRNAHHSTHCPRCADGGRTDSIDRVDYSLRICRLAIARSSRRPFLPMQVFDRRPCAAFWMDSQVLAVRRCGDGPFSMVRFVGCDSCFDSNASVADCDVDLWSATRFGVLSVYYVQIDLLTLTWICCAYVLVGFWSASGTGSDFWTVICVVGFCCETMSDPVKRTDCLCLLNVFGPNVFSIALCVWKG